MFFIPILLVMPFGAANYVFLLNAGELTAIEDIARAQQQSGGLYGTAVHKNSYAYKLALYAQRRPRVVVIGSSRVLQLRDGYFSQSFVNLGRTVDYPLEAEKLVTDLLDISKPDLVLFGIDYWWGNPRWVHAFSFARHQERGGGLTPDALLAPTNWLIDGKITLDSFIDVMRYGAAMYGVQALTLGNGYGPDGSYYYAAEIAGRARAFDAEFSDTIARIQTGRAQFRYGSEVMAERIDSLRKALALLSAANVPTITFLPPLAPLVFDAVRQKGEHYAYIAKFREAVAGLHPYHYDFHDPSSLDAGDCEFVDGFHGGEVVYARMLTAMAEDTGNGLAAFMNMEKLEAVIRDHAGTVLVDKSYQRPGEREVDFLKLGCDKS